MKSLHLGISRNETLLVGPCCFSEGFLPREESNDLDLPDLVLDDGISRRSFDVDCLPP